MVFFSFFGFFGFVFFGIFGFGFFDIFGFGFLVVSREGGCSVLGSLITAAPWEQRLTLMLSKRRT